MFACFKHFPRCSPAERFAHTTFIMIQNVILLFSGTIVLSRLYVIWKGLRATSGVPLRFCLIAPLTHLGRLLPSGYWNPGQYYFWDHWKDDSAYQGSDAVLYIPLLLGEPVLVNRSADVFRDVLVRHTDFPKANKSAAIIINKPMGPNIAGMMGDDWRRHRRVAAPAFNNDTYEDVWNTVARLYQEMQNSADWRGGDSILFKGFNHVTTRLALLVIAASGFNMRLGWEESLERKDLKLHTSVEDVVVIVSQNVLLKLLVPNWVFAAIPSATLRRVGNAYDDLSVWLRSSIADKRAYIRQRKALGAASANESDTSDKNVFGRLVAASEAEGSGGLSVEELTGNMFILLFAGHETTAHTLAITMSQLALNPKEQERVVKHIQDTVGDRELRYTDFTTLTPVLQCFYEGLRMYPPATVTTRLPKEDCVLPYKGTRPVTIRAGTKICLDHISMNRNPRFYADPGTFSPLRWEGKTIDDLLSFTVGPRACLGRKLALVEAASFLSHMLRDWKVEPEYKDGVTSPAEWQDKFLYPVMRATMATGDIPLRFTRRS